MSEVLLTDAFARLLQTAAGPETLRRVLALDDATAFWPQVEASGFLDALVAENRGGGGLRLSDITPLAELSGYYLVPAPVCETMVARAVLSRAGYELPTGFIALGWTAAKSVTLALARTARHALIGTPAGPVLVALTSHSPPVLGADGLSATVTLETEAKHVSDVVVDLSSLAAALATAQMAGVARRILEVTVEYANLRQQFGKPIGKLQAIQQQLAVMAEKVVAIRMSGYIACAGDFVPDRRTVAAAKIAASSSVPEIAAIAHAVHGAIGLSEEHDLQLLTKRLHAFRAQAGAEGYWAEQLGALCFTGREQRIVDLVRSISPA